MSLPRISVKVWMEVEMKKIGIFVLMVIVLLDYSLIGQSVRAEYNNHDYGDSWTVQCLQYSATASPNSAASYTRYGARGYAEQWALNFNSNYKHLSSDCTNFVSQAMHDGGEYPMQFQSPKWYMERHWWGWTWSNSWTVIGDLINFVYAENWGYGYCVSPGYSSSAWYGDIITYDWNGDGIWDHASMETVYNGHDPNSGVYGDLVDQHTTNRKHAIWTLQPYNPNWQTTIYGILHLYY